MMSPFTATYIETDGWIVGWVNELPGVMTQGRDLVEARENLKEAFQLMLETQRELHLRDSAGQRVLVSEPFTP
jgi:predicted RNase H-like HicB family nuclease